MTRRIVSLQILRFVAALMVVYWHAAILTQSVCGPGFAHILRHSPELGGAGVDLFFVISGFVITITGPLAAPMPTGGQFFWRRWSRVAPVFYVLTIPTILVFGMRLNTDQTIATLLFWPAAGARIVTPYLTNGWTLCFEMVFYTAVALIMLGGKLRRNLLIGAAMAAVLVVLRQTSDWDGLLILANPVFLEFGAGVALALLWPRIARLGGGFGVIFLAGALGIYGLETLIGVPKLVHPNTILLDTDALRRIAVLGAPAALLVAGALVFPIDKPGRAALILARLGDASYSLYLVHPLVMQAFWLAWLTTRPALPPALVMFAAMAISVVVGFATFLYIERPLLAFVRRAPFPARRKRPAPAKAPADA
jgi:exopolysaccharide production protein ExoZ